MTVTDSSTNTERIIWTGDLRDDCIAHWAGLLLHAEQMDRTYWWWAVYDDKTQELISDSHGSSIRATNGKKARKAAEAAARRYIEMQSNA